MRKFDKFFDARDNIGEKSSNSTILEVLNMNQWQQLLIVLGGLMLFKPTMKLLWKTYPMPTALYFAATKLFWPKWAEANTLWCIALFTASVVFFVLAWYFRYVCKKRREQQILNDMLANATYYYFEPQANN